MCTEGLLVPVHVLDSFHTLWHFPISNSDPDALTGKEERGRHEEKLAGSFCVRLNGVKRVELQHRRALGALIQALITRIDICGLFRINLHERLIFLSVFVFCFPIGQQFQPGLLLLVLHLLCIPNTDLGPFSIFRKR